MGDLTMTTDSIFSEKRTVGQTARSLLIAHARIDAVTKVVNASAMPLDVHAVATACDISEQAARRALNKAIAMRLIRIMPKPNGKLPRGRQLRLYGRLPGAKTLDECEYSPDVVRLMRSPFAAACGVIQPPIGKTGRIIRQSMEITDDEVAA